MRIGRSTLSALAFAASDALQRSRPALRRPLLALVRLHRRLHRDTPLVLVAGSSGRATARGLIAEMLAQRFRVVTSHGQHGPYRELPWCVLRTRRGAGQAIVLELAPRRHGDARLWRQAVAPDVVVLTDVGDTELRWLETRAAVLDEQLALSRSLAPGGALLVNTDDPLLAAARSGQRRTTFGSSDGADFVVRDVRADASGLRLRVAGPRWTVALESRLLGAHHALPITAAVACAAELGVEPTEIARAVREYRPEPHRLERIERSGLTVLDDTWSASPQSAAAALDALALLPGRRVAVLGDMKDLGDAGPRMHRELGERIAREHSGLHLLTCGALAHHVAQGARAAGFDPQRVQDAESELDLLIALAAFLQPGDAVLVESSRGARLNELVAALGQPPCSSPLAAMPVVRPIGAFGALRDGGRRHQGIDLPAAIGTPVRALADGEVVSARFEPRYGYVVRLRHLGGATSVYAHSSRILVRHGAVARGQVIARSGRSGIFRNGDTYDYPHLHFEVRLDGVPVDPARYLPAPLAPTR